MANKRGSVVTLMFLTVLQTLVSCSSNDAAGQTIGYDTQIALLQKEIQDLNNLLNDVLKHAKQNEITHLTKIQAMETELKNQADDILKMDLQIKDIGLKQQTLESQHAQITSMGALKCTVQSVTNSTNDAGGSTVYYGVTVTHTCNTGYNYGPATSVQTTCNGLNQWSTTLQDCQLSKCTVQSVANSANDAGGSTVNYGVTVTHTCYTGYMYGSATSVQTTCNGLNQWSVTLQDCQLLKCTVQSVANSANDAGGSTVNYGVTVTHTCNIGYLYGSASSVQTTCNGLIQWPLHDCQRCAALKSVSSSENLIVHRGPTHGYQLYGGWAKDTDGKVYWLEGYVNANAMTVYPSESSFVSNVNAVTRTLPVGCTGANHNVFDGKLYCKENNRKNVVVIDLVSFSIVTRIAFDNVEGNVAGKRNQCRYGWSGFSGFDIESDEHGLWVIWGRINDNCNIGLSKIDPIDNTIEQTWWVPASKTGTGNAFMRCGVLYVIASYSNPSYIQYTYDTATSSLTTYSSSTGIPWYNHHGFLTHAHYDRNEKVVYVWDNAYQSKISVS